MQNIAYLNIIWKHPRNVRHSAKTDGKNGCWKVALSTLELVNLHFNQ